MLELQHLTLTVPAEAGQMDILKDVSLTIDDNRFVVITGPNGGGKTSLAKVIMGLNTPPPARSSGTARTSPSSPSPSAPGRASPTASSSRPGSRA